MELNIEPQVAMCDRKVSISICDLPPLGKVKVDASMSLPWAEKIKFSSSAWFTADASGVVDLSKQTPDSGSYDFVDGMGLLAIMKPNDKKALAKIGRNISVDRSLFIDITAQCERDTSSIRLERLFLAEGIKRQRISEEFMADLFYSEEPGNRTVVFLGGSGSELGVNSVYAALLAAHGFNVLSVAYFREKGLPPKLSEIPLEYFDRVFAWLSRCPVTKGKEIYLFGISKGAELALLLASRNAFIKKVAAFAPHAYCFQGIAFKNVSSWTHQGKSLPFIPLKTHVLIADAIRCFAKNEPFGFARMYEKCLAIASNKEEARIKIENSEADLLLFTSRQCNMWNTYDGCMVIMDMLRKSNYKHGYDLVVYEDAGEPYFPPYMISYGEAKLKIAPRFVFSMGGTPKGNAHAQGDSWEKTIQFLKK
jgi:esterase/lipase